MSGGGIVDALGWRIVWLPEIEGDVWVIPECRVLLVDTTVTAEQAEDVLLADWLSSTD